MYREHINQNRRRPFEGLLRLTVAAVLLLGLVTGSARAAVQAIGDVRPLDNPFTLPIELTLPIPDGNFIDLSIPDPLIQTTWELDTAIPGYPTTNTGKVGVVVGQRAFGRLDIDGSSVINGMTLIIGDEGEIGGQTRQGTGFMLISGIGARYNNDPNIAPPGWPLDQPLPAGLKKRAPDGEGFNMYVGRAGVGTLVIQSGGRAEIQNRTIVAALPASNGSITVDGFGSFLQSGGFDGNPIDGKHMAIGRQGIGTMTVSNGGTVLTEVQGIPTPNTDIVGAALGVFRVDDLDQPPGETLGEEGGQGTATVIGPNSKWIVGGTLVIGGYHNTDTGILAVPTGEDAVYSSQSGRGTLNVYDGGAVSLRPPIDTDPADPNLFLRVLIGRFGRLNLRNGTVDIGPPGVERQEGVQIVNDGVITGSGRINTGTFRNRYFGEVRIGPGQSLIVDATSDDPGSLVTIPPPLINYGLIEVNGTRDLRAEIEFERAPNTDQSPIRPFINRPVNPDDFRAFDGGQISARDADLRFRSGLFNEGSLLFTGGMNTINGRVDNIVGPTRNGLVFVGPQTTVVSADDFASGGTQPDGIEDALAILNVRAGGTLIVENAKSLTIAGTLEMELSFTNPSKIQVAGDLGVNATLVPTFASDAITSLGHGDVFELISAAGDIGGVDFSDPLRLAPDLAVNPVLNVFTDANFNVMFPNLDLIATPINNAYYLFVIDPTMVGSVGVTGADFNGDGVVDADDLAIWLANVGISMGASPAQGDADGDGDVDGDDFLIWQSTLGPVPGSGAIVGGNQNLAGTVPEPTSLLLLAIGVTGLATRRRRASR